MYSYVSIPILHELAKNRACDTGNADDEHIEKYKWDGSLYRRFIAPETSKLDVPESSVKQQLSQIERRERGSGVKNMNMARAVQPPEPEEMQSQFLKALDTKKLLNFKLNIN